MLYTREGIQLHLEGERSQGQNPKNSEEEAGGKREIKAFQPQVGGEEGGRCEETPAAHQISKEAKELEGRCQELRTRNMGVV